MPRLPRPTGAEMIRFLESQGFRVVRVRGGHHILVKGELRTTVPVHGSETLRIGTLRGADSAEVHRRLAGAMARAGWRNQWVRVAQDSTAIRQPIAEGRQVLAFDESAGALEALGWALTSPREWTVGSPGRRVIKVWSVEPPGA